MRNKQQKSLSDQIYIEIGPNLKDVINNMIAKVNCSDSGIYLANSLDPICNMLKSSFKIEKGKKNE